MNKKIKFLLARLWLSCTAAIIAFLLLYPRVTSNNNPLTPDWTIVTILFEAGVLGGGSWFVFCQVIPYLARFESLHEVSGREKEDMRKFLRGVFKKARRWPDSPLRFMASYTLKGVGFILLLAVMLVLLTSKGWVNPFGTMNYFNFNIPGWLFDLVYARTTSTPNGAHILSYIPIPAIGLYVAWKFSPIKETMVFQNGWGVLVNPFLRILYGSFLGLLVAAAGVAIHESLWLVFYYGFYYQYLSWGVLDNVIKDAFFAFMLFMFLYTYTHYPFQVIPLNTFKAPALLFLGFLIGWSVVGFHISTINNFVHGQGIFGETDYWPDLSTNATETASWDFLYLSMLVAVWRLKFQRK